MENLLFLTLMSCIPGQSWYSLKDSDGGDICLISGEKGFAAGVNLPVGTLPMVLPMELWEIASKTGASELPLSYRFDPISEEDKENLMIRWATR